MKQTINFNQFVDGFSGGYKDNFSYEGKEALYNYLTEYEESTGEELEFDPIALCCEFTEYKNFKELQENYKNIKTLEELQDRTTFIPIHNFNDEELENFIIARY